MTYKNTVGCREFVIHSEGHYGLYNGLESELWWVSYDVLVEQDRPQLADFALQGTVPAVTIGLVFDDIVRHLPQ